MPKIRLNLWLLLPAVLALLAITACSDSSGPATPTGDQGDLGGALLEGSFDPGAGTFVLKTLDVPTFDGTLVRMQLVGSDLVTDPELDTVELMVALRSLHPDPLFPPVQVWLSQLAPAGVAVLNGDLMLPVFGPDGSPTGDLAVGFDYSDLLGDDGLLSPEETSGAKLWRFSSPGLAPFTFGARAEFGLNPDLARLGGVCFHDDDRDGVRDPGEAPLPHGVVLVTFPDGDVAEAWVQPNGRYSVRVSEPGLYQVFYDLGINTFAPISFSTPNPRQVVLVRDAEGVLQGFGGADFGLFTDLPLGPPPIRFTDLPADSLHFEPWNLLDAHFVDIPTPDGTVVNLPPLALEVGFSGCQPEHPFSLYMSGGFLESMPVQARLVAVHELAEECDAAFTATRVFDLRPLRDRFLDAYGPGVLLLQVTDYFGQVHTVEWGIFPED